ncbi:carbohydrate kinase [Staphylococcus muscae]|uniref:Fructokinase n=1 Tax=Staphylococcus muscae TaxID=1294 RepID=A0A240C692_9STAP|nr:carbohydrate kinase [Staphylococcus muscae]AVQ33464.1 carbohydrate kinase [Staphylococcus muscae]PNZ04093.1 carbohydrate kinase [Staphylococcus muscae]GGA90435.1 fructokinase [Staphylococcus muscae]SNW03309.1 putative fructokinase [Staphylococcus muscae]
MSKAFYAIGEALIDFIPTERDQLLKNVDGFMPQVGGAPCNVAAAVQKLAGNSQLITQLGQDAFGDRIVDALEELHVGTQWITRTSEANTALAFVSLTTSGERDFSFYRKPSADMLYAADNITDIPLKQEDMVHFCSVALVESPMKQAHEALLEKAHKVGATVVFDPNVRLPLWDDHQAYQETIQSFIPHANIIKISDEELTFITKIEDETRALQSLFKGRVEAVIYTQGGEGASLIFKDGTTFTSRPKPIEVVDTTGAGDAFIGAVIAELMQSTDQPIETLRTQGAQILTFANDVAGHVVQKYGALSSLPTRQNL